MSLKGILFKCAIKYCYQDVWVILLPFNSKSNWHAKKIDHKQIWKHFKNNQCSTRIKLVAFKMIICLAGIRHTYTMLSSFCFFSFIARLIIIPISTGLPCLNVTIFHSGRNSLLNFCNFFIMLLIYVSKDCNLDIFHILFPCHFISSKKGAIRKQTGTSTIFHSKESKVLVLKIYRNLCCYLLWSLIIFESLVP